jgi:hypothetical protein
VPNGLVGVQDRMEKVAGKGDLEKQPIPSPRLRPRRSLTKQHEALVFFVMIKKKEKAFLGNTIKLSQT